MTDVIDSPNFLAFFATEKTSPIIGAINSTFSGGAVFGSLMGGLTMDRFGRKVWPARAVRSLTELTR
jgi:MFS family permease